MISVTMCGKLIKQINDALEKIANNTLRGEGLTVAQVHALLFLHETAEKQMPLKQMEQGLRVAQSTAAGIIIRLEQKQLVESFYDSDDMRIKIIKITPLGEACCQKAYVHMEQAEKVLLSPLTKSEQDLFRVFLTKIRTSLESSSK